ncbi:hypothetical protein KVV02_008475 [Mortierella alpina]|uniref:Uncharacterized protein n=1 Tax=Mortierella alpina TaxID=64518 RepID=A0A9P8A4X9_MORAP|nr:hypothetical protein KVV02_008475 [Mortierella alpina]
MSIAASYWIIYQRHRPGGPDLVRSRLQKRINKDFVSNEAARQGIMAVVEHAIANSSTMVRRKFTALVQEVILQHTTIPFQQPALQQGRVSTEEGRSRFIAPVKELLQHNAVSSQETTPQESSVSAVELERHLAIFQNALQCRLMQILRLALSAAIPLSTTITGTGEQELWNALDFLRQGRLMEAHVKLSSLWSYADAVLILHHGVTAYFTSMAQPHHGELAFELSLQDLIAKGVHNRILNKQQLTKAQLYDDLPAQVSSDSNIQEKADEITRY